VSRKVVLVTGASAGLGASIATELAGRDWDVLAASRRGLAPAGGSVRPVVMDVTSVESVRKSIGSERLDAIVCNAGINAAAPAEELDDARARSILETNFWGVVNTVRAALPKFRQQGQGCIVVIGSLAGLMAPPGASYYAASKHALEGWLESLQYEVAGFGVRVHLIEPGFIRTDLAAAEPVPASLSEYDGLRERL
jgi:NAD(P)-dependent dehydrogenase (short-subunit alcohol dehydrogenase family)